MPSNGTGTVLGTDGKEYFVPLGTLPAGYTQLIVGQRVEFESSDGETANVTKLLFASGV